MQNKLQTYATLFSQLKYKKTLSPSQKFQDLAQRALELSRLSDAGLTMQPTYFSERMLINIQGKEQHLKECYLKAKLKQWEAEQDKNPDFIEYLEKLVATSEKELNEARQHIIPYFSEEEREQYKVEKFEDNIPVVAGNKIDLSAEAYLYVMDLNKNLYVCEAIEKEDINLHHSSFMESLNVTSAGMMYFKDGALLLNNFSGHYLPTKENFADFLKLMKEKFNVDMNAIQVLAFDLEPDPFWYMNRSTKSAQQFLEETKLKNETQKELPLNAIWPHPLIVLKCFDQELFVSLDESEKRKYLLANIEVHFPSVETISKARFNNVSDKYFFIQLTGAKQATFSAPLGLDLEITNKILHSAFAIKIGRCFFSGSPVKDLSDAAQYRKDEPLMAISIRSTPKQPSANVQTEPSAQTNTFNK